MGNRVCEMLNIEHPIIQGGMAWVATASLAAAVSQAGGLGIIGAGNAPADIVKVEIDRVRALTDKPFGVNVMLMSPYVEEVAQLIKEEKVPVVTTGAGSPSAYLADWQNQGIRVIPVVASVALARRLERSGVDAIIAEGQECGGHIGDVSTMALVPQVVDAVSVPVIAAGGIGDGRGALAAFCLGAEAVQMGTRFICCSECTVHPNYQQAIIKAKERDAVICGLSTGHPVRALRNQLTRQLALLEKQGADITTLEGLGSDKLRQAVIEGEIKTGSLMAGQIAGIINQVQPAEQIISEILAEMDQLSHQLGGKPWRR